MIRRVGPSGVSIRVLAGYLAGIALGTMSITLLFLGMRAVMDVGGACADGGPYVSAQPCPDGVPLAMIGGMFGLFGATGLIVWFGSRLGAGAAAIVALGWPALFFALGFNFLDYALRPPDGESVPVWGWLIPGVLFWLMGGAPLAVGAAAWRAARAGRSGNRLSQVATGMRSPLGFGRRSSATSPRGEGRLEFAPESWGTRPVDPSARPVASASPSFEPSEGPPTDIVDDLARLARLHAAGDLTDDEFAAAKLERLTEPEAGQ
jgi:hypothetical protein